MRFSDPELREKAEDEVWAAMQNLDSVGGVVDLRASGFAAGLGEPAFDKLDARLGAALFSLGGVKGVEIGSGFAAARQRGSEYNDTITPDGTIWPSNNSGGVLGGISTGQELRRRFAVKPSYNFV